MDFSQSKLDTLDGIVVDAGKRVELFRGALSCSIRCFQTLFVVVGFVVFPPNSVRSHRSMPTRNAPHRTTGKDLVDAVLGGNFSKLPDVKKLVDGLSREDMPRLCAKLMHANYFHRAVPFELEGATSKKKRRGAGAGGDTAMRVLVDGQRQGVFDEDAIFIWVLPVSQKWLAVQVLRKRQQFFVCVRACVRAFLRMGVWMRMCVVCVRMRGPPRSAEPLVPFFFPLSCSCFVVRCGARKALLLGVFVIFICCIKIWPLWLKIAVWWISLILLGAFFPLLPFVRWNRQGVCVRVRGSLLASTPNSPMLLHIPLTWLGLAWRSDDAWRACAAAGGGRALLGGGFPRRVAAAQPARRRH